MDRLRWYSELSPGKHIKINLPEFKLDLIDQEQSFLSLNVIIGKRYNSTPVIMDSIKYIVVNPDWTVPQSIAVNELLPQIKKGGFIFDDFIIYESWKSDAAQINPDSIDWAAVVPNSFHYKIIQRPGLANPLGRIKFLFPNNSNIYLHDTPFDYLFDIPQRTFSHGCIRVADPFILACRLLEDDSAGTAALIDSYAFEIDSSIYIPLKDPVPIVIEYKTVFMDELRRLNFRADIYRHDSLHVENLKEKGEKYKINGFLKRFKPQ
jgi:murein L,D-transpeptidase YcbB/YkuD